MGGLMSLMLLLQIIPLATLATVCTVGVFSHHFHDTLGQRVALSLVAMGSCLQIVELSTCTGSRSPLTMIVYGAAIFAVFTFLKIYRSEKATSK
jgi:predicted lysophospholipase L1 biosynthesis ABC-type transport system permease subunit